ncbi:hypothetical protein AOA61_18860 [Pseudomonas sp. 2995-1]|nr:hypothetical protein AOA61_18860 [Pseudomonas sp. 2995-1]
MHNLHTPKRPDGFAKYRARHRRDVRHSLLLLPPAKRRALRRNLIFIGLALSVVLLIAVVSKANAAGAAYAGVLSCCSSCSCI